MAMRESTRNILRMHGRRVDRAVHNYVYFKYYYAYVLLFLKAGRFLARWLRWVRPLRHAFAFVFESYHSKVLTEGDARKIITLDEDVVIGPDRSSRIIPYGQANQIVLQEPEFIAVMDCPCRLIREDGCQPVNVCLAVGKTTAQFWVEHCQKYHARRVTQDEALQIILDARGRGCMTTGWFKVATGGRTGVICSCCSCCCGGIEGMHIAKKFDKDLTNIAPSGYAVERDAGKCVVCGHCAAVCPFGAITFGSDSGRRYEWELCMGCGLCTERCEQGALSLVRDADKGDPLDLDLIRESSRHP
jgi:Pyruvate/2-oxoacid:ferredoxin oxidoreductase delta subunit